MEKKFRSIKAFLSPKPTPGSGVLRTFLRAKIHRATVTGANADYVGSISIDQDLLDESGIAEFEQVHVWDITNAARFVTYAISAPAGSKEIVINGAAAKLVNVGDKVIIAAFCMSPDVPSDKPKVVVMEE